MDVDEIRDLISELPDLTVLERKYYPGEIFFNRYGRDEPLRVGCRYSDKSMEEGNASEEFILLVEIFDGEKNLVGYESETYDGREVFYGYVPDFPVVERFIEEEGRDFLSWSEDNKIYTLVDLKGNEREVTSFNELPGLKSYSDSRDNKRLKRFLTSVKESDRDLKSPFPSYAGYLPSEVDGWGLVTFFIFTEAVRDSDNVFLISGIQGNYRYQKSEEYLNLKLMFGFSFLPENIIGYLKPRKGRRKTKVNERDVYVMGDKLLSHYNEVERYSIEVSGDDEKRYDVMEDIMSQILQRLEGYSCIEASVEFIRNVGDMYVDK
jgi:hypothetical protein